MAIVYGLFGGPGLEYRIDPIALSREDRRLTALNLALVAVALVLTGVNALFFRYAGVLYFPRVFWPLLPPLLLGGVWGLSLREEHPDAAFVVVTMCFYLAAIVAQALLATGIQYTPFAPIDVALARGDAALGFNVSSLLPWTYAHPRLERLLWLCYYSVEYQLFFVPLLACLLRDRGRVNVFLHAVLYSFLIGGLFYYFFPSSGPAGVYGTAYFAPVQRLTSYKFYCVHHFKPLATIAGGMIAFPSFHVVWGILLPYLGGSRRWLFYPVLALNALMIASTVLLGWHFLVDVAGGAALAGVSLGLAALANRRV